jgi:hypothetical protein
VHQEGLKDKVSKKGPEYQYPDQPLLGFCAADQVLIRDSLMRQLVSVRESNLFIHLILLVR